MKKPLIIILAVLMILNGIVSMLISFPFSDIFIVLKQGGVLKSGRVGIIQVLPNSPAATAGLKAGDNIVSANGKAITTTQDFGTIVHTFAGRPLNISVDRQGQTLSLVLVPRTVFSPSQGPTGVVIMDAGLVPESPQKFIPEIIINAYSGRELNYGSDFLSLFFSHAPHQDKTLARLRSLIFGLAGTIIGVGLLRLKKWSLYGYCVLVIVEFVTGIFLLLYQLLQPPHFMTIAVSIIFITIDLLIIWYLFSQREVFS